MGLPVKAWLHDAMGRAAKKAAASPIPEKYLWNAVWWRLSAKESANPAAPISYAVNMVRLARDMASRPHHYRWKSPGKTDWQWMHFDG